MKTSPNPALRAAPPAEQGPHARLQAEACCVQLPASGGEASQRQRLYFLNATVQGLLSTGQEMISLTHLII